jgi:hypothetical protein
MAVVVCSGSGGSIPAGLSGWYFRRPAKLLNRAETNAIGFAKRTIDSTGLGPRISAPRTSGETLDGSASP